MASSSKNDTEGTIKVHDDKARKNLLDDNTNAKSTKDTKKTSFLKKEVLKKTNEKNMGCTTSTKQEKQRGNANLANAVHGGDPNDNPKSKPKIPSASAKKTDANGGTSVFEVAAPQPKTNEPAQKSPSKSMRVSIEEPRNQNDESGSKVEQEMNMTTKAEKVHDEGATKDGTTNRKGTSKEETTNKQEISKDRQKKVKTNENNGRIEKKADGDSDDKSAQRRNESKTEEEEDDADDLQNTATAGSLDPNKQSAPLNIHGTKNDITDLNVDVIVSSEDPQLQGFGMVAKLLEKKGGDVFTRLKKLTASMCPQEAVPPWGFTSSPGGGKIKCKRVFHANAVSLQQIGDQMKWLEGLRRLLFSLFLRADQMGFTSLALPLLGTGRLGASSSIVIELFVETITTFKQRRSSKAFLSEIYIVHPDKKIVNEVQKKVRRFSSRSAETSSDKTPEPNPSNDTDDDLSTMTGATAEETCPICMDSVTERKELPLCHHVFCKDCIDHCFSANKPACPICNTVYGTVTGNQPQGYMLEVFRTESLPGFEDIGTIFIHYVFNDGIQEECHPNKGKPYKGTKRNGFLPDNDDGQKVYRLLRRSFEQRLTFTIGNSRTTGKNDVVTWNDVHHKTRFDGGPESYGYPDPSYISRVLDELRAKGITED